MNELTRWAELKRWAALAVALTALLGLTIPAVASAGRIEAPKNTLAPVGTVLTAKSSNLSYKSPWGTLKCASVEQQLEVVQNDGVTAKVVSLGPGVGKICTINETQSIGYTPELTNLTFPSNGSKRVTLRFDMSLPGGVVCHLEASEAPVTYTIGTNSFSFGNAALVATPSACGPMTTSATFSLTESLTGRAVILK